MGAGGPVLPLPGAGAVQADRQAAARAPPRPRAVHRHGDGTAEGRAGGHRHQGRPERPGQAHLFDLAEDAAQGPGVQPDLRRPCSARTGPGNARLLHRAGHRAHPLAAHSQGIRRLHRQPQGERLPLAAHRGDRPGRQGAGGADPHPRHARGSRAGRVRALAVQGHRRQVRLQPL
ncbi:hypothetical protein D9M71_640890 [compost metagenome]